MHFGSEVLKLSNLNRKRGGKYKIEKIKQINEGFNCNVIPITVNIILHEDLQFIRTIRIHLIYKFRQRNLIYYIYIQKQKKSLFNLTHQVCHSE